MIAWIALILTVLAIIGLVVHAFIPTPPAHQRMSPDNWPVGVFQNRFFPVPLPNAAAVGVSALP